MLISAGSTTISSNQALYNIPIPPQSPLDGTTTYSSPDTRFLSALTGGFLLGWGITIWCLSSWVYDAVPEGVRRTVVTGMLAWFVLDSAGSIASGNASNVVFNMAVLLLAIGPMWRPVRE